MNDNAKKVVLNSRDGYDEKQDALLQNLLNRKIRLFCVVGKDAELWEEMMDELFVGEGDEKDFFIITTSHKDETLEEVIEFARSFTVDGINNDEIEIIQV